MKLEHYETVIRCLPLAQRAIALVLKLLVLNLRSKFKVRDDSNVYLNFLRRFRGAAEAKLLELLLLIIVSAALRNRRF